MDKRAVNIKSFRAKVAKNKGRLQAFVQRVDDFPPDNLDTICSESEIAVWNEIDCTTCANCCKRMSPTYTPADIKRIAAHLGMSIAEFKKKWLYREEEDTKDWLNVRMPCQFLDLNTNRCTIYEVRPTDCATFPHLAKKDMKDYFHVHRQNVAYCPATYHMIEKMMVLLPEYL